MHRFLILAASIALGLSTLTGAAHAQDERELARVQFERGVGLYESHDYEGALAAFQEAYRIAPHPTVRVNMANCYEQLGRPLEAVHHFEQFLSESPSATRAQRREVQQAIQRLREQLGEVRLTVTPDGATVTIDEHETRRAPLLEPLLLTVGEHTLVVSMEGYRTSRQTVTISGGDTQGLSIRLARGVEEPPAHAVTDPTTTAAPETAAEAPEPDAQAPLAPPARAAAMEVPLEEAPGEEGGSGFELRITTPVIVFGATTAALAVAATVTGALAVSYNDQFEDAVRRVNAATSPAERRQARADGLSAADTANTLSIVTDVLIIGALAAAGATAFFVISDGTRDDDPGVAANGLRLLPSPLVLRDGGGIALDGWF